MKLFVIILSNSLWMKSFELKCDVHTMCTWGRLKVFRGRECIAGIRLHFIRIEFGSILIRHEEWRYCCGPYPGHVCTQTL